MKGFIELTDSLDWRCTIKVSCITRVSERMTCRYKAVFLDLRTLCRLCAAPPRETIVTTN